MSESNAARRWLTGLSLTAGIVYTASAEFELAEALGAGPVIAAMLPLAIDVYVIAGVRWGRWFDVALSLSLMGAAQIAAHALDAGVLEVDLRMVVVVSLLVPISIWRVHVLARGGVHSVEPPAVAQTATVAAPERDLYAELAEARVQRQYGVPAPVDAVPEAYPEIEQGVPETPDTCREAQPEDPPPTPAVLAARAARTRPEVEAEYVPGEDEYTADARTHFAGALRAGSVPSVRTLRDRYSVGQRRAQTIRDELRAGVQA